LLKGKEIHF